MRDQHQARRINLHYGDMRPTSVVAHPFILRSVNPTRYTTPAAQRRREGIVRRARNTPPTTDASRAPCASLEAVRILGREKQTRIYQASTSDLFGDVAEIPPTERPPFHPRSPYAVAKLYAFSG